MRRSGLTLFTVLTLLTPPLADAQVTPVPAFADGFRMERIEEEAPERLRNADALGLSGAVRVLISAPERHLSDHELPGEFDGGMGHRWIPLRVPGAVRILGEPTHLSEPFHQGEVRTPTVPGVWSLEGRSGSMVTVITQIPASHKRGTHLNGYHIGEYPTAGRTDAYAPPSGFVEVTLENRDLPVSEHLTLGQFLTKDQFDVWPKYVALDMRLVDKLELVIQELNAMGIRADHIHVMSGFRTPQYNGPGGDGRAALSRHMWGDAADVWIDSTGDGQMDDLNGDGRIDLDDAAVVMRAVERVERKYPDLIGGAGTYPSRSVRGPYIHIDVRGRHSRW